VVTAFQFHFNLTSVPSKSTDLDSQLTMKTQVHHICRSSSYRLRQLQSIRSSLSETSCSALFHVFITRWLDYCNSLLARMGDGLIAQLQSLIRVAAQPLCSPEEEVRSILR
jgi:hypothetical protein